MSETELMNLKEAIIDLYLAIKIRSTEEVRDLSISLSNKPNPILISLIYLFSCSLTKLMNPIWTKRRRSC